MPSRKKRAEIAKQTVEILDRGSYEFDDGKNVTIAEELRAACEGTVLYAPDDFAPVFSQWKLPASNFTTTYQVVNCTTLAAARRIVDEDGHADACCLNFASAKNPGGGFLNGSQAQEESLARASGLYACINPVRGYYDTNRGCGTCLYTHHMIYSPRVPVFRDDDDQLLAVPYKVSFVTAPAVNAGAMRDNEPGRIDQIESTMQERIDRLLAVALRHGHRTIILGAWGCGVFRNDPIDVARWFHSHLVTGRYQHAFRSVVFAVLDRTPDAATYAAFAQQFAAAANL